MCWVLSFLGFFCCCCCLDSEIVSIIFSITYFRLCKEGRGVPCPLSPLDTFPERLNDASFASLNLLSAVISSCPHTVNTNSKEDIFLGRVLCGSGVALIFL